MKRFILRILDKAKLLVRFKTLFRRNIQGREYTFPLMNGIGRDFLYSDKEPWMDQLLKGINLRKDQCLLDIGANIGQTMIRFNSLYPKNPYTGCEPNPFCVEYLENLIKTNGFTDYRILPVGLSDSSGSAKLYRFNNPWDAEGTLIRGFRESSGIEDLEVKTMRGDDFVGNIREPIGLIKIDVEGGELEVIKGLDRTIDRQRPVIICEILPVYRKSVSGRVLRQQELVDLLHAWHYLIFRIQKNPKNQLNGFLLLEEIEIHGSLALCDYVFLPGEKDINMIFNRE